jgi:hypothetical protein
MSPYRWPVQGKLRVSASGTLLSLIGVACVLIAIRATRESSLAQRVMVGEDQKDAIGRVGKLRKLRKLG